MEDVFINNPNGFYTAKEFKDQIPLTANDLNTMQQGIIDVENEIWNDVYTTPEYYYRKINGNASPEYDQTTDWTPAFREALKSEKRIICQSGKLYHFNNIIDLRPQGSESNYDNIYLDGNGAYFDNFHIYANIQVEDDGTVKRSQQGTKKVIFKNMYLGQWTDPYFTDESGIITYTNQLYWDNDYWKTPCFIVGGDLFLENICSLSYPYIVALTEEYSDQFRVKDCFGTLEWDRFLNMLKQKGYASESPATDGEYQIYSFVNERQHPPLDAISMIKEFNTEEERFIYSKISSKNDGSGIAGDGWHFTNCTGFEGLYVDKTNQMLNKFHNYYFITTTENQPILFEQPVELNINIIQNSHCIFLGGHWEKCGVTLSNSWGSIVKFINCFFYTSSGTLLNDPKVSYENCHFFLDDRKPYSELLKCGRKWVSGTAEPTYRQWHEISSQIINCQWSDSHNWIINNQEIKRNSKALKRTFNAFNTNPDKNKFETKNASGDTTIVASDAFETGNGSFSINNNNITEFQYTFYLFSTSQESYLYETSQVITLTPNSSTPTNIPKKVIHCSGGYSVLVVREGINSSNEVITRERIDFFANPDCDGQALTFYDYGQYVIFEETNSNLKGENTTYATPIIWLPVEEDDKGFVKDKTTLDEMLHLSNDENGLFEYNGNLYLNGNITTLNNLPEKICFTPTQMEDIIDARIASSLTTIRNTTINSNDVTGWVSINTSNEIGINPKTT